jgi:hypothetical protein
MNILDNSLDVKKTHEYQLKIIDNVEYNNYLKYLNIYYEKPGKKQKYNKYYLNGKYVLEEISNPSKKIYIEPTKFFNINILYINLKENIDLVLNKISGLIQSKNNITEDNRNEFEILKKKYIIYKKNIESIDNINKTYYDELNALLLEKINITNNLAKNYQKREEVFGEIKVMIKETLKNKLIKIFKENKRSIPSISQINKIAKENNIPSDEIEKWFNWIESVYIYMNVKNELYKINNLIELKEKNYEILSKNMIIKEPSITK